MTWRDKLEIGLKDDAPFRRDNLPDFQKTGGGLKIRPGDPTRSREEPGARQAAAATDELAAREPAKRLLVKRSKAPSAMRAARRR